MTDDKIAKAVERLGEGTPGPWLAGCGYAGNGDRVYGPDNAGEHSGLLAVTYKGWVNAQKIAALPELAAVFVAAATLRNRRGKISEQRDLLHPEAGDGRTWNAFQRDFAHAAEIVSAKIRALKKEPRT
jgi:hypothetical protein